MPGWAFKMMAFSWKITDIFMDPTSQIEKFNIQPGDTVLDYGCGPGRYIAKASNLVGANGKVYAVDIHDKAITCVRRIASKKNLRNVYPVKANGYFAPIPENTADIIYVLDVFHMISSSEDFLNELHRLIKPSGKLILEDGHQKRAKSIEKLKSNGRWQIVSYNNKHLNLNPLFKLEF